MVSHYGWLIYARKDYEKNREFARRFIDFASDYGLSISLVLREDIIFGIRDGSPFIDLNTCKGMLPRFAINRCMDPLLGKQLEIMGIRVFNPSAVSEVCNDKARTYQRIADLEIPMVDTVFSTREYLLSRDNLFEYPAVIKSAGGRGGAEVYKAGSLKELREFVRSTNSDRFVVQKLCGMPGRDVRVFVVGRQIVGAVERYSDRDFRANYSLGGAARLYSLSNEQTALVRRIIDSFKFDMVGIDFIFDSQGNFLFNEIEDVVGTRTLYMNSNIDIVRIYLEHIRNQMQNQ